MNLNPLTLIENVIVEHGSSVIQGKHLALLKEQVAILKEQLTVATRQFAELQSENEHLKTENANLRQQVEELTVATQQQRTARRPDEKEEQILLLLTNRQKRTVRDIAARIGVGEDRTEVMLHALKDASLVGVSMFAQYYPEPAQPSEWYLTIPVGQKYLSDWSLIQ